MGTPGAGPERSGCERGISDMFVRGVLEAVGFDVEDWFVVD